MNDDLFEKALAERATDRRGGALSRLEGTAVLVAVDAALRSPGGLDAERLAGQLGMHRRTVVRYVYDLCELGAPIGGLPNGPYSYTREFALFGVDAAILAA